MIILFLFFSWVSLITLSRHRMEWTGWPFQFLFFRWGLRAKRGRNLPTTCLMQQKIKNSGFEEPEGRLGSTKHPLQLDQVFLSWAKCCVQSILTRLASAAFRWWHHWTRDFHSNRICKDVGHGCRGTCVDMELWTWRPLGAGPKREWGRPDIQSCSKVLWDCKIRFGFFP